MPPILDPARVRLQRVNPSKLNDDCFKMKKIEMQIFSCFACINVAGVPPLVVMDQAT